MRRLPANAFEACGNACWQWIGRFPEFFPLLFLGLQIFLDLRRIRQIVRNGAVYILERCYCGEILKDGFGGGALPEFQKPQRQARASYPRHTSPRSVLQCIPWTSQRWLQYSFSWLAAIPDCSRRPLRASRNVLAHFPGAKLLPAVATPPQNAGTAAGPASSGGQNGGLNPLYQVGGPRSAQLALKLIF